MRHFRLRFCGAVVAMLRSVPDYKIRFYTLVPHAWRYAGDELATVSPKKLLEQFRAQFNRAGGPGHSGVLIAFVHGEYDRRTDTFQLHLHVLTVGGKAKAIEKLRNSPVYQVSKHVRRPIVKRKVKNRARQVSYHVAQGFWPAKPTALVNGVSVRTRERQRIPEPRHAEVVMWLDRQRFSDLIWLHGCRFSGRELVRS
jgi:hypothetical protein